MLEHISSDFDFDLDHPLPITIPLLLISPPEPPRSPLRPASRSPVVRCSLPSPPSTPRRYPPLERSYATYRGQSFFPSSPEEEEDEEDKEWGLLDIQSVPPTPPKPSTRQDLDVNDRAQMFELMRMDCTDEHCAFAAEVVGIIVPAYPSSCTASEAEKLQASKDQAARLARRLSGWCSLSRHPLCTLISTVILLERVFALHPRLNEAGIQSDTFLRLSFASFLIAMKATSDGSLRNYVFVRHTSWNLESINMMERELLEALKFDVYVPSSEFLHRASGFWTTHLHQQQQASRRASEPNLSFPTPTSPASSLLLDPISPPDPFPSSAGNLFLAQRRSGVEEKRWKGGIVHSPRSTGRRMSGEAEEQQTVWKDGRLERTEGWTGPGLLRKGGKKRKEGGGKGGSSGSRRQSL